jgi:hypothetical protein
MRKIFSRYGPFALLLGVAAGAAVSLSSLSTGEIQAWPNRNAGPGCECHSSGAQIRAEYLGGYEIEVEVVGATSPVAGELVRDDEVVDEINIAGNPFILHVHENGTYTINAGLNAAQRYGTTTIDVSLVKVNCTSWGFIKGLFR